MKPFKRFTVLVMTLVVLTFATAGCSSSWFQNFKSDPVAKLQVFENTVQTTLGIADVTWNSVKMYLPPDIQARAQVKYDLAVVSVHHVIALLNDAVQAAVEAQNTSPDFSKLIQEATDAVQQVIGVINEFRNAAAPAQLGAGVAPKPTTPVGYDDLNSAALTMKRVGGSK